MNWESRLTQLVIAEIEEQQSVGFSFWRTIPSSEVARTLALLTGGSADGGSMLRLHRDAVLELCRLNAANNQGTRSGPTPMLNEWVSKARQPWNAAVRVNEWSMKGWAERKLLARELISLRNEPSCRVPTSPSSRLLDHYSEVSDGELAAAVAFQPIKKREFLQHLATTPGSLEIRHPASRSDARISVSGGESEILLELDIRAGTMSYAVYGFFGNPVATATYEGLVGIGIGEWDRLEANSLGGAAAAFKLMLAKLLKWRETLGE